MLLFKKQTKKKLYPANIQLNLGVSPPQNSKSLSPLYQSNKKKSYSISISPDKPKKTINTFSSHNLKKTIKDYYNNPKLNLMKKISMFKNNLKNTLFNKDKSVSLDLGNSPPRKIEQTSPKLFGAKLFPTLFPKPSKKINSKKINSKKKSLRKNK